MFAFNSIYNKIVSIFAFCLIVEILYNIAQSVLHCVMLILFIEQAHTDHDITTGIMCRRRYTCAPAWLNNVARSSSLICSMKYQGTDWVETYRADNKLKCESSTPR